MRGGWPRLIRKRPTLEIYTTLWQKRFLLAAKTPLCWRAQHPPAILCQYKWLSLLAGARPPPLTTVLAGDISTRQHSGFSKSLEIVVLLQSSITFEDDQLLFWSFAHPE
jgi:hypothetical protein